MPAKPFLNLKSTCICVCFSGFWRPFRRVTDKGSLLWDRIHHLEKGQIYKQVIVHSPLFSCKRFLFRKYAGIWSVHFICCQGNLYEFLRLTGWRGSKVLYFGDHIYSDLAVRIIFCRFLHVHKHTGFVLIIRCTLSKISKTMIRLCKCWCNENIMMTVGPDPETRLENRSYHSRAA